MCATNYNIKKHEHTLPLPRNGWNLREIVINWLEIQTDEACDLRIAIENQSARENWNKILRIILVGVETKHTIYLINIMFYNFKNDARQKDI